MLLKKLKIFFKTLRKFQKFLGVQKRPQRNDEKKILKLGIKFLGLEKKMIKLLKISGIIADGSGSPNNCSECWEKIF